MIGAIENGPVKKDQNKQTNKDVLTVKIWDTEEVKQDLEDNIDLLYAGKSKYKTLPKIASRYRLTVKEFRSKCFDDTELSNLLLIYNGMYVDHIMNLALSTGKMNKELEGFLQNEVQAFTNSGTEQVINWHIQTADDIQVLKYDDEKDTYSIPIEIEPDVNKVTNDKYETVFDKIKLEEVEEE